MSGKDDPPAGKDKEPQERILHGFPVFSSGGGRKVTHELINRLLDEEDEEIIAFANRRRNENDPGHR